MGHESDPQAQAEIAACFGHFSIDIPSRTVTWSVGVASIFGRPLPASGFLDLDEHLAFYHPDDAEACRVALADASSGYVERPYRSQGRVIRPDGTIRHVMSQGTGRSDGEGRLRATSGILVDVTEAVMAEEAAREGHELLRATFEAVDQGIVMVGADRRIRVQNSKAKLLLGLPDELSKPGTPFADVLRYQEASGEFDALTPEAKACLPVWSKECTVGRYMRERPNGTVLEICTASLSDGGFVRTYTDVTERRARDAAIQASEERYRLLAETTTDVVIWAHLDSTRRYVSPAAKALFGFEPEDLVGTKPADFVHPDEADSLARILDDLENARTDKATATSRYRCKDGSYLWVEISFSLVRDPGSKVAIGYVASIRDISDRKAIEDALRRSEERLVLALESGGEGIWDYDLREDRAVLIGSSWSILGYDVTEIEPTFAEWRRHIHPDDLGLVSKSLLGHLQGQSSGIEVEYRVRAKSGAYIWMLTRGRIASRDHAGHPLRLIGTHMDVSRRKQAENAIVHMAHHDVLTGLPNRAVFLERLTQTVSETERHGGRFALLACDLDRFKAVNDTLGHAAGDELLREIAKRLKEVTRTEDLVARLGGDEFSILLGHIDSDADAYAAAQRLIEAVEQPVAVSGRQVQVGVSIGVVFGLDDGRTADELCRRADTAMYVAKSSGRNTFKTYQPEMDALLLGKAKLEGDLQDAVRRGGFLLFYQPIFGLMMGNIIGFEALLRWQHPTRGPVSPAEFIPLAEQTGLMVRLGEWALREACRQAAAWGNSARIGVNISGMQFHGDGLEQTVRSALAESGLDPSRLELEVTETVLLQDIEAVLSCLSRLQRIGVRIAFDNFGTGHSGLNHLRRFRFDAIKLHRSLVNDLGAPESASMIKAIVSLHSATGQEVIAEGVETREVLNRVRKLGCTGVQGFLFSEAVRAGDASRLANSKERSSAA